MRELLALRSTATAPTPDYGVRYAICPTVHPMTDSCIAVIAPRFFLVFKWMLPVYGALHFIPMILFKRKLFMKNPTEMLLKAGWGTTRSSAFLGVFVIIYQSTFICPPRHLPFAHPISYRFLLLQTLPPFNPQRSNSLFAIPTSAVCH